MLFACILIAGCQSENKEAAHIPPPKFVAYDNPRFNFGVDAPDNWEVEIEGAENYEATDSREAIPDSSIRIFVENLPEERVMIIGQLGTLNMPVAAGSPAEDFVTKSGLKATKYTESTADDVMIYYVFDHDQLADEGYNTRGLGVSILMSKEIYDRNKETIEQIVQSIRINK